MTILGIDLSSFGVDVVELNERDGRAHHHRYDLGKGDILERVRRVHYVLPHRDRWERAVAIGLERPAAKFGAWQVSMVFGAVLQCLPYGILVTWLTANSWKARALGKGHGSASKDEVLAWAGDHWADHPSPLTQDAADAYGLAVAVRACIVLETA